MLKQFRDELKQFDDSCSLREQLDAVRKACDQMAALARWRNSPIHARVRPVHEGVALYNWKTKKRPSIGYGALLSMYESVACCQV